MDQARSRSPYPKSRIAAAAAVPGGIIALLAVGHGANDFFTSILPALLPALQERFALSASMLALLVATFAVSSSFLGPFLGGLSDRFGARRVMALAIALTAVLLSLVGVVSSVALLFALLLVGGLGSAALHPAGSALARQAANGNPGLALALFSAGGMIGYAAGPVLILFIADRFGMGATAWLMIPGLLAALLVYVLSPSDAAPAAGREKALFDRRLFTGPVGVLTVAGTLNYLPALTFMSALPLWLVQARGVDPSDPIIGFTLGLFSLASAGGGVAAGLIALRVAREILVSGAMLLALGALVAVFLAEPGSLFYYAAVAVAGALSYAAVPLMGLAAQDLAPRHVASASGMLLGFATGVSGLLYVAVGRLQEVIGVGPAMGAAYLALVPAAFLAYGVLRHGRPFERDGQVSILEAACRCLCASCGCHPESSGNALPMGNRNSRCACPA